MAGVHGLEHIQGFAGTDLADDDAVRPHPQGVFHQIPDAHLAAALHVAGPGLQPHHVVLEQLQLGGILYGDDPLVIGNEGGQHIQGGGLAAAGTPGNHHVEPPLDAETDHLRHFGSQGAEPDQILHLEGIVGELTDGEGGAVQSQGRDNGIDPGAVGQPGIHHGGAFVDAPPDGRNDLLDDVEHMVVVFKMIVRSIEQAAPLHVDLVGAVDHDLVDLRVIDQGCDGAETGDFVHQLRLDPVPLGHGQVQGLLGQIFGDEAFDGAPVLGEVVAQLLQVDFQVGDDAVLDAGLQFREGILHLLSAALGTAVSNLTPFQPFEKRHGIPPFSLI